MNKDRKRIRRKGGRYRPPEIESWTQALSSAEEFLLVSSETLDAPHLLLGGVRIEHHVLHVQGHRLHHPDEIPRGKDGKAQFACFYGGPAICSSCSKATSSPLRVVKNSSKEEVSGSLEFSQAQQPSQQTTLDRDISEQRAASASLSLMGSAGVQHDYQVYPAYGSGHSLDDSRSGVVYDSA
jgi:hypothetical protein